MRYSGFLFAALVVFGMGTLHVNAQSLGADPLTVTLSPQYPQPYDTVSVTPQSTLFDLNASTVTISVNGTVVQKGSGGRSASYQAGTAGATDTIVVSATSPSGTYQKTVVVHPASVALILEPQTSAHPFYAGALLMAPEGRLRLIALPEFRTKAGPIPANTLSYTWKLGDQILVGQSGIGRSVLTATAPLRYRSATVSVTVSSPDGTINGTASLPLSPLDPTLLIYHNDPLAGPDFDTALGDTFTMTGNEDTFRAVPYFFPDTPNLAWQVNGQPGGTDPVLTVRTTGDSAGTASLSVTATRPNSYLSAAEALTVRFGQNQNSPNIFGL